MVKVIILVAGTTCLVAAAQTSPAVPHPCSISGRITAVGTGAPVAGVLVLLGRFSATTNSGGRYTLDAVPPGQYSMFVRGADVKPAYKTVTVGGQDLDSIDFQVSLYGRISGRVLGDDDRPVQGINVMGLSRSYRFGTMAYRLTTNLARTNSLGEFEIPEVFPDVQVIFVAAAPGASLTGARTIEPVSDAPADPKDRRLVTVPSYYPDATLPEGGLLVTLRSGEHRREMNFRLRRTPSYCVNAVLEGPGGPAPIGFSINWVQGKSPISSIGGFAGKAGPDGKIRVCDLFPGDYRISAYDTPPATAIPSFYGETSVVVADRDTRGAKVTAQLPVRVPVQTALEGQGPGSIDGAVTVAAVGLTVQSVRAAVPGTFSISLFPALDYGITVSSIPKGWYLKDVTYAGISVFHRLFRPISSSPEPRLRIVLARDGGIITVKVADRDGNPVVGGVSVFPEFGGTDAEFKERMVSGQTDQAGVYTTEMLPPGKYYVIASSRQSVEFVEYPETTVKLRQARAKATEVEISSNTTAHVTLEPVQID